jgi:hypothetical protein
MQFIHPTTVSFFILKKDIFYNYTSKTILTVKQIKKDITGNEFKYQLPNWMSFANN